MIANLVRQAQEHGGKLIPLVIDASETSGTGLTNPTIYKVHDKLLVGLRNVDYTLYLSEDFRIQWGQTYTPFAYLHKDSDARLKTVNFMCELDADSLDIVKYSKVDTSKLDVKPNWSFVGLEDARLVMWDGKLYMCGVRRDVKSDGQGRMEMSEIKKVKDTYREVSRMRIEPPGAPTYCEKNWMPVDDMPYHFIKWTNPTELVKVDPVTGKCETVLNIAQSVFTEKCFRDLRGGSQVIRYKDYRIALTHEVTLGETPQKNKVGAYYHRFVVWDLDWNAVAASEDFVFIGDPSVEFVCGMVLHDGNFVISFGYHDNAAYLLQMPTAFFDDVLNLK